MKHLKQRPLILLLLIISCNMVVAQDANTSLSNLVSPTAVNVNLLPGNSKNLGSASKSWKDLYLGGILYINGNKFLQSPGTDNTIIGSLAGGNTNGGGNTFIGKSAGQSNTTGAQNIFVGKEAGFSNTLGINNIFIGERSGYNNKTRDGNVGIGDSALFNNELGASLISHSAQNTAVGDKGLFKNGIGYSNTAMGYNSMMNNSAGFMNTAVGASCLFSNSDGLRNTALGNRALYTNTSGNENVAAGDGALFSNDEGSYNTAVGSHALHSTSTGSLNVAIGYNALYYNTTSGGNAALGDYAGYNTTGPDNTFIGDSAGIENTSGFENTFVGEQAGFNNSTGDNNTFVGNASGGGNTSGIDNVIIGANAGMTSGGLVNAISVGFNSDVCTSNSIRLGNTGITKMGIGKCCSSTNILDFQVTTAKLTTGGVWTNASDPKLKDMVTTLNANDILKLVNQLSIRRWHYKADAEPITHIGPMSDQFYALFKTGDDSTISTIDPSGVALLAIQALSAENNSKGEEITAMKATMNDQKKRIENLENRLLQLETILSKEGLSNADFTNDKSDIKRPQLMQNVPNPVTGETVIRYFVPAAASSAQIIISTQNGGEVIRKEITIGEGSLEVNTSSLGSGIFMYSLVIDGVVEDTKEMVIGH